MPGSLTDMTSSEKATTVVVDSHEYQNGVKTPEVDWTEDEEKRLVRKIDLLVMPLLMLGCFALQLDRGNIGNALTDFFLADVGITQNQFNTGQQLLSVGIVLLEIPSNLVLYRVGPTIWLGSQIIAWGLVATLQAFQKGLGPFIATRLLLGLCEAGFNPAGLYTITRWYKRHETSKRFSWFYIGHMLSVASSGLFAYGMQVATASLLLARVLTEEVFKCELEGIFTVLFGITFLVLFPRSISQPISLLGVRYFTERESHILASRVLVDDPTKAHVGSNVSRAELKAALTNWRLIPHILATIGGIAPSALMMSYAPTLVNSYGYDRLKSNAMVSIGAWCLLVTNISWGMIADKLRLRGLMVSLGILIFWGFTLGNRLLVDSKDAQLRFTVLTLGIAFASEWHAVNGSWMALNARSAGERSVTLAIFIMSANCSGIVGSQLFQQQDGPLYRTGWTAILALVSMALLASIVANLQYYLLNRRSRKGDRVYVY